MDAPLDQTVAALEGGLTSLSPSAATGNIDTWMQTLDGNEALSGIREDLGKLKTALTSTPLDGSEIGALLVRLGSQTSAAAAGADPASASGVARLGSLLEKAGTSLTGSTSST